MEVIVKPTDACNGTCVYCAADGSLEKRKRLPPERLADLFGFFRPWLAADERRVLRFIWHGGEPLLCGPDYFRSVVAEERRVFGADVWRLRNTLQSNLTLADASWIPVLHDLLRGETVGTSFDLVPGVRGLRSGEDLSDRWLRAVTLLRSAGIAIGLVYVVHRRSLDRAEDLHRWFANVDPAMRVRYNPLYPEGRAADGGAGDLAITPAEYGRFLLDLADVWMRDGMRSAVMPLAEWRRAWRGDPGGLCCDSRGTCHDTHLGVDPDGTVHGCGRASDHGRHPLGNVFRDPIAEVLERAPRGEMATRGARLLSGPCRDCRWWTLCHGGCPMMSWLDGGDFFRETPYCESNRMVFERFEEVFGPASPGPTDRPAAPEESIDVV